MTTLTRPTFARKRGRPRGQLVLTLVGEAHAVDLSEIGLTHLGEAHFLRVGSVSRGD